MKKFLAILLIAIIACTTVEQEQAFQGFIDKVKELYNKLKEMGVIDALVNALRTYGKPIAKKICCEKLPDWCSLCDAVIDML